MDVVKLWSSLLANCAIGTNICSIPAAYFMQGTADVQVVACANESNSSLDSDESNPFHSNPSTNKEEEIGDAEHEEAGCEEENAEEEEENDTDEIDTSNVEKDEGENEYEMCEMNDSLQKKQTKVQRNRYSREEYRCTMCTYTCTTEKAFLRHLRGCESAEKGSAEKQMAVSCPVCGKDRKGEQSLSVHMKKHKDDKHFCCDICKFRTLQLKKLIQHRRMHTGERPHLCPFCSYRSARRDNLRSHARRVHKKENLPCDTFTPRSMLVTPSKAK